MDPIMSGRAVAGMGPGCWEGAWVLVGLGCAREGWGPGSRTGLPQASITSGNRALFRCSPRHPSSRPIGTCGSGQGAAEQAFPRCPHLLHGPPRPLCLTLALFSLHGHLSLLGECSRYFCRLSAGTFPPAGWRACGVHAPRATARVPVFLWSVECVRNRLLLLTFPQKLLNV